MLLFHPDCDCALLGYAFGRKPLDLTEAEAVEMLMCMWWAHYLGLADDEDRYYGVHVDGQHVLGDDRFSYPLPHGPTLDSEPLEPPRERIEYWLRRTRPSAP